MRHSLRLVLVALLLCPAAAPAAGPHRWGGVYAGVQLGANNTALDNFESATGLTLAGYAGYMYPFMQHFVLGGDVFYEWNQQRTHNLNFGGSAKFGTNVYGADVSFGFPLGATGSYMPYAKVGYGWANGTGQLGGSGNAVRYGAGFEWRLSDVLGLNFQFMHQNFGSSNQGLINNNWTVGANWHFN